MKFMSDRNKLFQKSNPSLFFCLLFTRRKIVLCILFSLIFHNYFSSAQISSSTTIIKIQSNNKSLMIDYEWANKCSPVSIDEFPPDFLTDEQKRHGGIVLHIAIICYLFATLEIVCDDYFATALERIAFNFNLTPDVAGATFMAMATSASEFFTSLVGVFFVKSDIALGTIVGSAVFNILFVIALCALITKTICELDPYPIVRDAGFYCIAVAVLYIIIRDSKIYWYEAMALVLLYFVYIIIMKFNDRISRFVHHRKKNQNHTDSDRKASLTDGGSVPLTSVVTDEHTTASTTTHQHHPHYHHHHHHHHHHPPARSISESVLNAADADPKTHTTSHSYKPSKKRLRDGQHIVAEATEIFSPTRAPKKTHKLIKWILLYPVRLLMHITIPDCRTAVFRDYYYLTFVMSTIWVAGLAYILVWLVVIVGYTLKIPDSVMGLTLLAAGSSTEEIFNAVVMTRRGHPEMAIAGSIGSNVFDILMGLGIPWLFRNLIRSTPPIGPDYVEVFSKGLQYSTIILFASIALFLITFFINRCRLTKSYGIFLIVIWFTVIVVMCMLELNIFGQFHPKPCLRVPFIHND
ncbi:unnamed protein product [Didymodactylos carnosus]|uniref:Sodium/calcium exchanger membrane region domain-containing protein n=1 Tax=Didymodactylos carnosus TaxID=1234261 RepID=A0A814H6H7_9BILA|nr:unnamed protein product [Didymodactylos carnosus]CAF1005978.1 unnamed protein product [Didymodactylos carnosus]CAF3561012.1 unnamed protein product [Didymodactylos carnosus]CAF3777274.1 unnamed protein product [Didymodactylos carnosus]